MLFRLLLIIVLFYVVRSLFLRLVSNGGEGSTTGEGAKDQDLDLSMFDIEDVEYHDLEEDSSTPGPGE
jgi:hypothetical protein